MTGPRRELSGLLRWYPTEWRARYGAELVALMEDELDGRRPTMRYRAGLVRAGLLQRARSAGLAGHAVPAGDRVRSGALVVLAAWAATALGGMAFAKRSEHYDTAVLAGGHGVAVATHDGVVALAVTGALLVAAGVALALPATVRLLRAGGWPDVRRQVTTASAVAVVAVVAVVGLSAWGHHLTFRERNGGSAPYGVAFAAVATLAAATATAWTIAVVAIARRLDLPRAVARIEGVLAIGVTVVIGSMPLLIGLWWVAMARGAAWFLAGTAPGTDPSVVAVSLVVIEAWLVGASAVALYGATRVTRSLRTI